MPFNRDSYKLIEALHGISIVYYKELDKLQKCVTDTKVCYAFLRDLLLIFILI